MTTASVSIVENPQPYTLLIYPAKSENQSQKAKIFWLEREISYCKESIITVKNCALNLIQNIFYAMGHLADDANALASVFRRLDEQVISGFEYLARMPGRLDKLHASAHHLVSVVDFMQLFADVRYFANKKFSNDTVYKIAAKVATAVADVAGALMWFREMGLLNLAKISASIADIRLFGMAPKFAETVKNAKILTSIPFLGKFVNTVGELRVFGYLAYVSVDVVAIRALTCFYCIAAIDAINKLLDPNDSDHTGASLDLIYYLFELSLDVLLTVGVSNPVALGGVGVCCIASGLTAFFYTIFKEKEETPPKPNQDNLMITSKL